jgi:hypothetical protein
MGALFEDKTGRLTVGRNMTLTLTLFKEILRVSSVQFNVCETSLKAVLYLESVN